MDEPTRSDKAEENTKPTKSQKPLEYRRFEKLLKQVVKAPPMPKRVAGKRMDKLAQDFARKLLAD